MSADEPTAVGPFVDPDPGGALIDGALRLLEAGGPVVAVLLGMSVLALTIVLVKLWQFRAAGIGDSRAARDAVRLHRSGCRRDALQVAERSATATARVLVPALRGQQRGLPDAAVREEVVRHAGAIVEDLRTWFRPLEVIAALAPLLGLFGTVLGMIEAFQQLEQSGTQVNPAILSGGIWQALLTTAVGLAVAMPVIVALNWLERRVDRLAHEIDDIVTQAFTQDLSTAPDGSDSHAAPDLRAAAAAG